MRRVAGQGWTCSWDSYTKLRELRVEGGLATKATTSPVASRGWTCNRDTSETTSQLAVEGGLATGITTNCEPNCETRMDLQQGQLQA